jgi:hypothetical protein
MKSHFGSEDRNQVLDSIITSISPFSSVTENNLHFVPTEVLKLANPEIKNKVVKFVDVLLYVVLCKNWNFHSETNCSTIHLFTASSLGYCRIKTI